MKYAIVTVILIIACVLRLYSPLSDVPKNICFCAAEDVDWTFYGEPAYAREGVVNFDKPTEGFSKVLFTGYLRVFTKLFGASQTAVTYTAFLPGIILVLSLGWAVFYTTNNVTHTAIALLLSATNFILITYSRVPTQYIFFCAAMYPAAILALQIKGNIAKSIVLTAAIIALSIWFKSVFIFLIPAIGAALLLSKQLRMVKLKRPVLAGSVFCLLLVAAGCVSSDVVKEIYYKIMVYSDSEQSMGDLKWRADTFIYWEYQYRFIWPLLIASLIQSGILIKNLAQKREVKLLDAFSLVCFLSGNIAIACIHYHPVRYFLFLVPATIYLAVRLLSSMGRKTAVLTMIIYMLVSFQNASAYMTTFTPDNESLKDSREDLREMISEDAVAFGNYARLLTIGSSISSNNYHNSKSTHSIINNKENNKAYLPLGDVYVRGKAISVMMNFRNYKNYSLYEEGILAYSNGYVDKAEELWLESQAKYKDSGASTRALLFLAMERNDMQQKIALIDESMRRNPSHRFNYIAICKTPELEDSKRKECESLRRVKDYAPF